MIGKILIIAVLVLIAVIGYEYYIGNFGVHPSTNAVITTSSRPMEKIIHYYNYSTELTIYSNTSGIYNYPISLPTYGNVSITISSHVPFCVKIYDNNTFLGEYRGLTLHKFLLAGGELELQFYNFTGEVNINLSEIY
ncbi:hypothetical protein SJAV_21000 [Sulfurisphaera javensis]|uniref:Sulfocyanin n=1 Tax=Sulfurisphaera javensis TaxID=2049879 RepID=A0AAT9GTG0_9CREN